MAGNCDEIDTRPDCKYGETCYQKNPQHHKKFKHPLKGKRKERATEDTLKDVKRSKPEDTDEVHGSHRVSSPLQKDDSHAEDETEEEMRAREHTDGAEDSSVPVSPEDVKSSIEQKFLLEMPQDFFDFWECCSSINKEKPEEALLKAGLTLVGPYDVLTGKLKKVKARKVSNYICHWRYYYDPPEFMTVITGDEDEFHIGYYRDDPSKMPVFVAAMSSAKAGNIKPIGENIFAGVCSYLTQRIKADNPFMKASLQKLYKDVESYAVKNDYSLEPVTPAMKIRNKAVVAKTFHGAGIVVPVHNDVGYREIPETYGSLKKMLKKVSDSKTEAEQLRNFDDIQELITNVQFASDEGDFGMGLELGLNLFTYGGEVFHKSIMHLLGVSYDLLGREPYVNIIKAHLKNRRRGSQLSIIDMDC